METVMVRERTLTHTMKHLHRQGFTGHFGVDAGRLREFNSGTTFIADEVHVCGHFRFEGLSDPGDMAIVYAIESRTGIRGTLVDAFGVYADPAISEFMALVARNKVGLDHHGARAA
jgi:hypothetical protein